MGWKDLIFADTGEGQKEKKGEAVTSFKGKFPTSSINETPETTKPVESTNYFGSNSKPKYTAPVAEITPNNLACQPHMEKIMGMYEKGFDDLNQDGYDFFEYYKAVVGGGIDNPMVYKMGFNMAKGQDGSVTKESLISQAQFYIDEIKKVHSHYDEQGTQKSREALKLKGTEESALNSELSNIDAELDRLTRLKESTKNQLSTIDAKYTPQITEIQCKLMANNMAKDSILGSIQKVVTEINKNL